MTEHIDPRDMMPQAFTAAEVAKAKGMTEAQARYVLDGLVERGFATLDGDDKYTISGLGLVAGERMGVTKPVREWPGVGQC